MDPLNLDNLTDLNDPLLSDLASFDTFTDLFDFNNLTDESNTTDHVQTQGLVTQNTLFNDQISLDDLLKISSDLDQTHSNNTHYSFNSTSSSNFSPLSEPFSSPEMIDQTGLVQQQSPVSVVFSESEINGAKVTKELVFNFEDQCKSFLEENYDFVGEKMEVIVDKNTSVDMEENSDDDSDDSESIKMEKFKLTAEEKLVFLKEGYKLPTHLPLTKSEEKLLKLVRRKIRNKKSAHTSRERKKKYVTGLEKRVEYCTKMNDELLLENKLLKSQKTKLVTKLKNMQQLMNEMFTKHKKSSTAVLFVSFFITFCIYPYAEPIGQEVYQSQHTSLPFKGYSRTLLSNNMSSAYDMNLSSSFEKLYDYYKDRYDL